MAAQVIDPNLPAQREGDSLPYALIVTLWAKPDRQEELQELLLRHVDATRAEPGLVTYHLNRERDDPSVFVFYEAYTDFAAFQRHLDSPYIAAMLAELPPYLARDNDMRFLTMSSTPA